MGWVRRRGSSFQAGHTSPTGEQITSTHRRKVDADAWVAAAEADVARGAWTDHRLGKIKMRDFYNDQYAPTMIGLEATTRVRDESYWRTHIAPTFGDLRLSDIDHLTIQAWVNELASRKAPATVVKARQILGKILRAAVRSRRLAYDPSDGAKVPSINESDDVFLTPAQVAALAEGMKEVAPRFEALVWVGCYCGPRIGEIAGLRWSHVDLLHRNLTIDTKVVEVSGHGMVEGATKTKAGRRSVPIPRGVVAKLEEHRLQFSGGNGHVFAGPDGGVLRVNNFRRREWAKAVVLAGLDPHPTPHDMRHTAVSLWISQGATDLQIARWAGHRSASFTKDRYGHLFPESGEDVFDRLDGLILSGTTRPAARVTRISSTR